MMRVSSYLTKALRHFGSALALPAVETVVINQLNLLLEQKPPTSIHPTLAVILKQAFANSEQEQRFSVDGQRGELIYSNSVEQLVVTITSLEAEQARAKYDFQTAKGRVCFEYVFGRDSSHPQAEILPEALVPADLSQTMVAVLAAAANMAMLDRSSIYYQHLGMKQQTDLQLRGKVSEQDDGHFRSAFRHQP